PRRLLRRLWYRHVLLSRSAREADRRGDDALSGRRDPRPRVRRPRRADARPLRRRSRTRRAARDPRLVADFVVAATAPRRERADELLAARPDVADDRWARLVLGRDWDGDP